MQSELKLQPCPCGAAALLTQSRDGSYVVTTTANCWPDADGKRTPQDAVSAHERKRRLWNPTKKGTRNAK